MSPPHLIRDIPYQDSPGQYHMVVEIPAGTNEKWQTDATTGQLYWQQVAGKPRVINFLSYPINYGFIPQTLQSQQKGGDGDPVDIALLAPAQARGAVLGVKILGAFNLMERGELDTKVIAVLPDGPFGHLNDLSEMFLQFPGAIEILRLWFDSYKGPGAFLFKGYLTREETKTFLEEAHEDWSRETGNPQA